MTDYEYGTHDYDAVVVGAGGAERPNRTVDIHVDGQDIGNGHPEKA